MDDFNIALIAPPWPMFNRPSIQLACLSAYLKDNIKDIEVRAFHPYLFLYEKIGQNPYSEIADSSWASEAFGAMLLYPQREEILISIIKNALSSKGINTGSHKRRTFNIYPQKQQKQGQKQGISSIEQIISIKNAFRETLLSFLNANDWSMFPLCGISISLNQLTSGLYIARHIKTVSPSTKIVIGGASVSGGIGDALLDLYPFIDFAVSGEGEIALKELAMEIKSSDSPKPSSKTKKTNAVIAKRRVIKAEEIGNLNQLPAPDFTPYFEEIKRLAPDKRFFPVIPLEFSRGCFWSKCAFCNLNIQWNRYRKKDALKMVKEIKRLIERFGTLDFAFMDNCLPHKEALKFFKIIASSNIDLTFFGELRADITPEDALTYKNGGLSVVQIGIEALSDRLLMRMRKGTRTIDNLSAMKCLFEAGIELQGNIITDFPDTSEEEIEETLTGIKYAMCFPPLKPVSFWLGYGSPIFNNYKGFGIRTIAPHRHYGPLIGADWKEEKAFNMEEEKRGRQPGTYSKSYKKCIYKDNFLCPVPVMIYEHKGTAARDKRRWKRVRDEIYKWIRLWEDNPSKTPPLSYRDGGDFLIIRQKIGSNEALHHRLKGASRKVFLNINRPITIRELSQRHPQLPQDRLKSFILDLYDKKIVWLKDDVALNLAVHRR